MDPSSKGEKNADANWSCMIMMSPNAVLNPLSNPISMTMGRAVKRPNWTTDCEAMAAFRGSSPLDEANLTIDSSKPLNDK